MQEPSASRTRLNATNVLTMLLGVALVLGAILTVVSLKPGWLRTGVRRSRGSTRTRALPVRARRRVSRSWSRTPDPRPRACIASWSRPMEPPRSSSPETPSTRARPRSIPSRRCRSPSRSTSPRATTPSSRRPSAVHPSRTSRRGTNPRRRSAHPRRRAPRVSLLPGAPRRGGSSGASPSRPAPPRRCRGIPASPWFARYAPSGPDRRARRRVLADLRAAIEHPRHHIPLCHEPRRGRATPPRRPRRRSGIRRRRVEPGGASPRRAAAPSDGRDRWYRGRSADPSTRSESSRPAARATAARSSTSSPKTGRSCCIHAVPAARSTSTGTSPAADVWIRFAPRVLGHHRERRAERRMSGERQLRVGREDPDVVAALPDTGHERGLGEPDLVAPASPWSPHRGRPEVPARRRAGSRRTAPR